MAEENQQGQEKTEEATDDRREKFRQKGDVVFSKELSTASSFVFIIISLSYLSSYAFLLLKNLLIVNLGSFAKLSINQTNILPFLFNIWKSFIYIITPFFAVSVLSSILTTIVQTKGNFSWEKINFAWNRLSLISGFKRIFSGKSILELFKGIAKIVLISLVSYSVLTSSFKEFPYMMFLPISDAWLELFSIIIKFFTLTAIVLIIIGIIDYIYTFLDYEKKIMMTKQELKEEIKQKEVDPNVKGRIRKIQREVAERKTLVKTQEATVLITNPTHYSIAIKYKLGMIAPVVLGKGVDHLALAMRKVANEYDIPIVENKLLARTLYSEVEEGDEIPSSLYKAVSEIIRYVFTLKGIKVPSPKGN